MISDNPNKSKHFLLWKGGNIVVFNMYYSIIKNIIHVSADYLQILNIKKIVHGGIYPPRLTKTGYTTLSYHKKKTKIKVFDSFI